MPKDKALAQKALAQAEKDRAAAAAAEAREAASWEEGTKKSKKSEQMAVKEAERLTKAAELKQLELMDDLDSSNIKVKKKPAKKGKGKDDFSMLNAALAAAPKTAAQKAAEAKKKADEEKKKARLAAEEERKAAVEREAVQLKKYAAKGMVLNASDELMVKIENKLDEDDIEATGLENALGALNAGQKSKEDAHPEKRMKALYNAYFERELPTMKEEQPGLKLSQYKERIFEAWQKSPENPKNQAPKVESVFNTGA